MKLELKLIEKACLEFWEQYHEKVEGLGFHLAKKSYSQGLNDVMLVASISPDYSNSPKLAKKLREILPKKFIYRECCEEVTYSVAMFPSLTSIVRNPDNFI